jgi:type IV pilus assembly protein PilW
MNRNHGFTLIELLVAMGIAALISLMVAETYNAVMIGGMRADASVSEQGSARNSLALMTSDIGAAGFMLTGPAGMNRCSTLLTYNGSASSANQLLQLYPAMATPENGSPIPGTQTAMTYASAAQTPSDALTLAYNNAFGDSALIGSAGVAVSHVTSGTVNSASLFVNSTSGFSPNDIDVLVLPTLKACIRLQITGIGGANNLVHNSGKSNLNPSGGFSTFNSLLSRAITVPDLQQALVQDMGGATSTDGQNQVTYSIRQFNGAPTLFRTVVNGSGKVTEDTGIASNVVYLRALFAPLDASGNLGAFVDWPHIVAANEQGQVGAVKFALLLQWKNVGNRKDVPVSIPVLDVNYPTDPKFEYQVFSRTVYLHNVAWSQP